MADVNRISWFERRIRSRSLAANDSELSCCRRNLVTFKDLLLLFRVDAT